MEFNNTLSQNEKRFLEKGYIIQKIDKTDEGFDVVWKEGVMELTLDKICLDLKIIPRMLKIDTDGNEKNVLLGASKLLANNNLKFIIMEKPSDKENLNFCYEMLKKFNFTEVDFQVSRNSFWIKKEKML